MVLLTESILFLFYLSFCLGGKSFEAVENFDSIYNFITDLKNNTDTLLNYVSKINILFCPDQPICKGGETQDRQTLLSTLPEYLDIGTKTVRVENIQEVMGVCCLPCSCSDSCQENDNCCLSKLLSDQMDVLGDSNGTTSAKVEIKNNHTHYKTLMKSECIPATVIGGVPAEDRSTNNYFMITRCFDKTSDNSDSILVSKCQNPSTDVITDIVPVTSLTTGRTYRNRYCAICNNDSQDIVQWNSTIYFLSEMLFFANTSFIPFFPETVQKFYRQVIYLTDIVNTPPFPLTDKRCIPFFENNCKWDAFDQIDANKLWIQEACASYKSNIFIDVDNRSLKPYRNVLCFFCSEAMLSLKENARCDLDENMKTQRKTMTALLNYKTTTDSEPVPMINEVGRKEKVHCRCYEVYDKYLDRCRHVYCPAGEFMNTCRCVQPIVNLSGMPILLTLKVTPASGKFTELTSAEMCNYATELEKTLQDTGKNITAEVVGNFQQITGAGEYYISVAIIRSKPGQDTKQAIKPFLRYLDSSKKLKMKSVNKEYSVQLSSRVRLWKEFNFTMFKSINILTELDVGEQNATLVYETPDIRLVFGQAVQALSPLLFCWQVQLNGSEFVEKDGLLTINVTTYNITVPNYYLISSVYARVCVDDYLQNQNPRNMGVKVGLKWIYRPKLAGFVTLTILVVKAVFE